MTLLTTQGGFLKPFAWVLGWIFNGLFWLIFLIADLLPVDVYSVPIIGISVILFTFVTKAIMLPLTIKQQKFSKLSNIMNPELQAIQAKYKDKKDNASVMQMQAETKAVYEKYGTSPSGGCLTMLIQLPIMFALYRVIYKIPGYVSHIKELCGGVADKLMGCPNWVSKFAQVDSSVTEATTRNEIIDKVYNLSGSKWETLRDAFGNINIDGTDRLMDKAADIQGLNNFFGISLIEAPGWRLSFALLIPILAGITQWLSVKLSENKNKVNVGSQNDNSMGNSMKVMNTIMPIMSVVFCITLPSCVGIYWIASSVFQIFVQLYVNKKMDNIDVEKMVQENIDKVNAKRAKKGLPPKKITNTATSYVEQVKKMEAREARKTERDKEIKESTNYYNSSAKPGSLAAKANMVRMFNEKNNNKNDKE